MLQWLKAKWDEVLAWFERKEELVFEDIVGEFTVVAAKLERLGEKKRVESTEHGAKASEHSKAASAAWEEARRASGVAAKVRALLEG